MKYFLCQFRWFLDPSDQNELYHPPMTIQNMRFKQKLVDGPFYPVNIINIPQRLICSVSPKQKTKTKKVFCPLPCRVINPSSVFMFLLKPFQLSTLSPSLSLSLCQNCRRQLRGAEGTGAAVIIDNYADLLTGCQQFVLSKLTAHRRPTATHRTENSSRIPPRDENLARNISANSDPNIKLIS